MKGGKIHLKDFIYTIINNGILELKDYGKVEIKLSSIMDKHNINIYPFGMDLSVNIDSKNWYIEMKK
mgnify:CR=1 FL=1